MFNIANVATLPTIIFDSYSQLLKAHSLQPFCNVPVATLGSHPVKPCLFVLCITIDNGPFLTNSYLEHMLHPLCPSPHQSIITLSSIICISTTIQSNINELKYQFPSHPTYQFQCKIVSFSDSKQWENRA